VALLRPVPVIQAILEGDGSSLCQSRLRSTACTLTTISEVLHFAFATNLPAERAWLLVGLAAPAEVPYLREEHPESVASRFFYDAPAGLILWLLQL